MIDSRAELQSLLENQGVVTVLRTNLMDLFECEPGNEEDYALFVDRLLAWCAEHQVLIIAGEHSANIVLAYKRFTS
jgi:hypothetical protein